MKRRDDDGSIHRAAYDAIDEDAIERLLDLAAGDGCDAEAVEALHAVAAETLLADALAAAAHARRRGRTPSGDDVGTAAERRRSCCEDDEVQWEFTSAKWEWGID